MADDRGEQVELSMENEPSLEPTTAAKSDQPDEEQVRMKNAPVANEEEVPVKTEPVANEEEVPVKTTPVANEEEVPVKTAPVGQPQSLNCHVDPNTTQDGVHYRDSRIPEELVDFPVNEDGIIRLDDVQNTKPVPVPRRLTRITKEDDPRLDRHVSRRHRRVQEPHSSPRFAVPILAGDDSAWDQVDEALKSEDREDILKKVVEKSRAGFMRTEAFLEAYVDSFVEQTDNVHQALLLVLRQVEYEEFCTEQFVIRLLKRGAIVTTAGPDGNTPLHLAAERGFVNVGKILLGDGAIIMARNIENETSLHLAIENHHSDFAVLMVKSMEPSRVRNLFMGSMDLHCTISLHDLLEKQDMKNTVLAVLDTMLEPIPGKLNSYVVHYSILDGDECGRTPVDPQFNSTTKSCLQKIAKSNNKEVVYHDVVRLLLRKKWKLFARWAFLLQFCCFLIVMATLTSALVLAARKQDPRQYNEPVDIFRGLCEAIAALLLGYYGISELNQLRIHKRHYFRDYYNYLDVSAVILPFLIVPFRVAGMDVQWIFAALGYLCNGLKAFKYAAVFRSTGAYVQILYQVMLQDIIQFGAIFLVFLVSFSGAFYFALRGEVRSVPILLSGNASFGNESNTSTSGTGNFTTSLDIYPYETLEYYHVLFTGVRAMVEGGSIVDQYFGPQGFKWLGVIIYLTFLFLVIVVLLNLLIAQMSDTYANVQLDAQRSLAINRAWIVARVEHNTLLRIDYRKQFFESSEVVMKPQELLERWEVPPVNEANKKLEKLEREMNKQNDTLDELRGLLAEQKLLLQHLVQMKETTYTN